MRHDPLFLIWTIHCSSAEEAIRLQRWLETQTSPEAIFEDEIRNGPAPRIESHRLGDYFESVRVLSSGEPGSTSIRLLFHRRPGCGPFWKDLMVRLLQRVRAEIVPSTATLEYRGDEEPHALVTDQ